MVVTNWVSLSALRQAASAHWAERARLLWPVRFTAGLNVFVFVFLVNQVHWLISPNTMRWYISDGLSSMAGAILGCYPLNKVIFPQLTLRDWWKQIALLWGIRFSIWIVLFSAMFLMPEKFGFKMLLVAGGYLVFHFAILWGALLKLLRLLKFVTPAGQRLRQIVASLAGRMNIKVRGTWQVGGLIANALAIPTTRELVFTNYLLEICTDEEVAAICVHELAHLTESKMVLVVRQLASLAFFPFIFFMPLMHQFEWFGLTIPYLWMFLTIVLARRLSRQMEKRADQVAANEQTDTRVYAGALEKLYRANQSPAVMPGNRQAHPHLYDRMLAAGMTPDFPRPPRAKRLTLLGWCYLLLSGFLIRVDLIYF
jgi:Zn-dependent protease with chaperone function